MVDISDDIPFLWRLSSHSEEGFCEVSMVVPFKAGGESMEHTIETSVLSFSSDDFREEEEEILEWNEDDIDLFFRLITNKKVTDNKKGKNNAIKVDLSDPDTIEIVQIVAAAGFGLALPIDNLLLKTDSVQFDFEVGSRVSLNTVSGYKCCVVAEIEEDEIVCVMLDKIESRTSEQLEQVYPHDLILLKRHQLLHPSFSSSLPTSADVLH